MDKIINTFHFLIKQHINSATIGIAVSGGVDSMALLHACSQIKELNIECATINHNLRQDSLSECEYVKDLCTSKNIKCEILNWNSENISTEGNIQHKARVARYNLLLDWCNRRNIDTLFIAHHRDDQVESFIMRQEKNSNDYGLSGISQVKYFSFLNVNASEIFQNDKVQNDQNIDSEILEVNNYQSQSYKVNNSNLLIKNLHDIVSKIKKIKIIRPFLNVTKKKIYHYATENQIKYFEDPSNKDESFDRVRIRLMSKDEKSIINQLIKFGNERVEIEKKANELILQATILTNSIYIYHQKLIESNKATIKIFITRIVYFFNLIFTHNKCLYIETSKKIKDKHIDTIISLKNGQSFNLKHCVFHRKKNTLYINSIYDTKIIHEKITQKEISEALKIDLFAPINLI